MNRRHPNQTRGSQRARLGISQHAIDRYIERVDPAASRDEARGSIARIVASGQVRSTPRHWMRGGVRLTPGLRFVYWAEQPDVCVLVLDGTVITILTRTLCRRPRFPVMPGDVAEPIYAGGTDEARTNPSLIETYFEEAA